MAEFSHFNQEGRPRMVDVSAKADTVRTAVATVESVFRMPHLARIDVSPAKKAEPTA